MMNVGSIVVCLLVTLTRASSSQYSRSLQGFHIDAAAWESALQSGNLVNGTELKYEHLINYECDAL